MREEINEIENRTIVTISETKVGSFKRSRKLTNLLVDEPQWEKTRTIKIKNEKGDIITNPTEIIDVFMSTY